MEEPVKLEINLDELRKRHLFIATPAYGGGMHCSYVNSLLRLQGLLTQYQLPFTLQFMFNESLISRARNRLVDMFLASEATDLLFIDADIEFTPEDVIVLWQYNEPIIGGAYPLKGINWNNVKRAVLKNPDISPEDLKSQGSEYSTHAEQGRIDIGTFKPIEVRELATGFMMIQRSVFETLAPDMPSYKPASNETSAHERMVDFFQVGVHADRYESEDYFFCRAWKEHGGKIVLCPWMKLWHHGSYAFEGNLLALGNGLGEVH